MKKLFFGVVVLLSATIFLSSCTKESIKPAVSGIHTTVGEKADVAKADIPA